MQNENGGKSILTDDIFLAFLKNISQRVRISDELKSQIDFNIFSLVTEKYHLENLHSDIIYKLLDPEGGHKQGNTFLDIFIDGILEIKPGLFEKVDFKNGNVKREENRIDISIIDEFSKSAIIIENKINGAIDQDRQIQKYIELLQENYDIKAIVYLTLNNYKSPDTTNWNHNCIELLNRKLIRLPANNSAEDNLVKLWIEKCSIISTPNNREIFNQYKQLLFKISYNMGSIITGEEMYNAFKDENRDILKKSFDLYTSFLEFPGYLARKIHIKQKVFSPGNNSANLNNFKWNESMFICNILIEIVNKSYLYKFRIYDNNFGINGTKKVRELLEDLVIELKLEEKDKEIIRCFTFPEEESDLYTFLDKILDRLRERNIAF